VKLLLRLVINIIRAPVPTYSKFDIHGCLMISPTDLTYRPKEHPKEKKRKKRKASSPTLLDRQEIAKIVSYDVLGVTSRSQATCKHASLSKF
jgi:hypothetical protein